jgi:hypothetical protein
LQESGRRRQRLETSALINPAALSVMRFWDGAPPAEAPINPPSMELARAATAIVCCALRTGQACTVTTVTPRLLLLRYPQRYQ